MIAKGTSHVIMQNGRILFRLAFIALGFQIGSPALWAQSAELSGIVMDANKTAIPEADLSLTSTSTNTKYTGKATESGYYVFRNLSPGRYVLTGSAKGFQETRLEDLALDSGARRQQDLELQIATVTEHVQVEANLLSPNMVDGTVERRIGTALIDTLPSSGNSLQSILGALPGVILSAGSNAGGDRGFASVNGQRTSSNAFSVDGVDSTVGTGTPTQVTGLNLSGNVPQMTSFGGTNSLVQLDAIEEVRVATSSYSAKLSGKSGGQFEFTTKSGTNQFHGSAGYYFRNEKMAANDWFANSASLPRAPLLLNQGSATIGGPLVLPVLHESEPQTFFFANLEILKLRQPTAAVIPALSPTFVDGVQDQAMRDLLRALPTATTVANEAVYGTRSIAFSQPTTFGAGAIKVDRNFGVNARAFVRFMRTSDNAVPNAISSSSPYPLVQPTDIRSTTLSGGMSWSSSHWTSELRIGRADNSTLQRSQMTPAFGASPYDLAAILPGNLPNSGNLSLGVTITPPATPIPYLFLGTYAYGNKQSLVTTNGTVTHILRRGLIEFAGTIVDCVPPTDSPTIASRSISLIRF